MVTGSVISTPVDLGFPLQCLLRWAALRLDQLYRRAPQRFGEHAPKEPAKKMDIVQPGFLNPEPQKRAVLFRLKQGE